jgi:hypothetical protein
MKIYIWEVEVVIAAILTTGINSETYQAENFKRRRIA